MREGREGGGAGGRARGRWGTRKNSAPGGNDGQVGKAARESKMGKGRRRRDARRGWMRQTCRHPGGSGRRRRDGLGWT